MQTSGISANPLLMLNSLLCATGSAASDVFAPPSSNKTDQAKSAASTTVLPPSSATQLSFDSLLALQSVDNTDNVKTESLTASAASTPEAIFLKEAHKSPMQRLRDQILQSMGMTEESLAQLPADERRAAEVGIFFVEANDATVFAFDTPKTRSVLDTAERQRTHIIGAERRLERRPARLDNDRAAWVGQQALQLALESLALRPDARH